VNQKAEKDHVIHFAARDFSGTPSDRGARQPHHHHKRGRDEQSVQRPEDGSIHGEARGIFPPLQMPHLSDMHQGKQDGDRQPALFSQEQA
jgi:hypothetical protein